MIGFIICIFYFNLLRYIVNIYIIYFTEEFEDAKSVNRRRTDNTMAQRIKAQTLIYKTLHIKLNLG